MLFIYPDQTTSSMRPEWAKSKELRAWVGLPEPVRESQDSHDRRHHDRQHDRDRIDQDRLLATAMRPWGSRMFIGRSSTAAVAAMQSRQPREVPEARSPSPAYPRPRNKKLGGTIKPGNPFPHKPQFSGAADKEHEEGGISDLSSAQ
jgi:hypothetical protein